MEYSSKGYVIKMADTDAMDVDMSVNGNRRDVSEEVYVFVELPGLSDDQFRRICQGECSMLVRLQTFYAFTIRMVTSSTYG